MKLIFFLTIALGTSIFAEVKSSPETFKGSDGKELLYRIYTPENMKSGKKIPIVLLLHGAGERGNDNKRQIVHGFNQIAQYTIDNKQPAIIIAPQCPNGKQWVNVKWNTTKHDMPKEPSESLKLAIELLKDKIANMPVDKTRIYITGLSMGGYGTWDAISRHPDLFAAALPLCGGADLKQAPKLTKLPIWTVHGDKDGAIPVSRSRDIVKAIKDAGGNPTYTEHPGVGHNVWSKTYSDKKILDWFFSQKK
ncbi:MAG: prolyl oligopeptidase family serine peptidase [Lentisphaeraceae bacterium]|nr:prolyl oligopeptidase family serine peptidase [Lentisphaeraceae bacterium]